MIAGRPASSPWWIAASWLGTAGLAAAVFVSDLSGSVGPGTAAGDAAVSAVFPACALLSRAPRRHQALLAAVGVAWAVGAVSPLAALHRAVLAHTLLAFPAGRISGARRTVVASAAYAVWLFTGSLTVTAIMFTLVGLSAVERPVGGSGAARHYPAAAAGVLAAWFAVEAWAADRGAPLPAGSAIWPYEVLLVAVAAGFVLVTMAQRRSVPSGIAGVVVQLDPEGGLSGFRNALAALVGDPTLELLEWDDTLATYVDDSGQPSNGALESGRLLPVPRDGRQFAAVRHRAGSLSGPGMERATVTSVRLAVEHAQLRRDEQAQLSELMASRLRLQASADTQRARIQARLRERVASPAAVLGEELRQLSLSSAESDGLLASAASELTAVAGEIDALTSGLRPRAMDEGLDAALADIARRSAMTLHVDNDVAATSLPEAVETATYFVCAEALANAAKHAGATQMEVALTIEGGSLVLIVRDHGPGGATLSGGTGLQGLADRVAALGGRLSVISPIGGPTTVRATLPLSAQPQPRV